jgi:hypothetical protein
MVHRAVRSALRSGVPELRRARCGKSILYRAVRFGSVADLAAPRCVGRATIRHARGDIPASESSLRRSIIWVLAGPTYYWLSTSKISSRLPFTARIAIREQARVPVSQQFRGGCHGTPNIS